MIEKDLSLGIQILAYVHCGEIETGCHNCPESQQEVLNCNNTSAENVVFQDDELGEFVNCPLRWITQQVYDWFDEYNYYNLFPGTAPKYTEVGQRFWD